MPSLQGWISIAILIAVLAAIITRPRNLNESIPALVGAAMTLLFGLMPLNRLPDLIRESADVLLFLTGMMILTVIVEEAGVFNHLADWTAAQARGSGPLLFLLVFLLGAIITALMSLDVTVIVLTPIVYLMTTRRGLPPLPYLFVCTFVANTASLIFPMSNLTNLLVYAQLDLSFGSFVATMWLPNLVALLTNIAAFWWIFRSQIPARFETPGASPDQSPVDAWFRLCAVILGGTLLALIGLGFAHQPLSIAAIAGALLLLVIGKTNRRLSGARLRSEVSWPVLGFVVGMLIVVQTVNRQWLNSIEWSYPHGRLAGIAVAVSTAALGSNIVNNVPMALLAIPFIDRAGPAHRDSIAYATLIGTNIGPTLTTYGSLATLLWLSIIRSRGVSITNRQYLRVALITAPLILLTSTLAIALT